MVIIKGIIGLVLGLFLIGCVDHEKECETEIKTIAELEDKIELLELRSVVPVKLPKQPDETENLKSCEVTITESGYYFGERKVVPEEIEDSILSIIETGEKFVVKIYADKDVTYNSFLRILDMCNRNKVKVVIATKH